MLSARVNCDESIVTSPPSVSTGAAMVAWRILEPIDSPPVSGCEALASVKSEVFAVPSSVTTSFVMVPVPEETLAPVVE